MTAMLMPSVNSYFAIYTLMDPVSSTHRRKSNWDLHATATDKDQALTHAKMLVLQPGVDEVHVKRVDENTTNGMVSVHDVKRWRRGHVSQKTWACACAIAVLCLTVFTYIV